MTESASVWHRDGATHVMIILVSAVLSLLTLESTHQLPGWTFIECLLQHTLRICVVKQIHPANAAFGGFLAEAQYALLHAIH